GAHGIAAAVNRIAEAEAEMDVAAGAVDDGAGQALSVGEEGEDVAPHGGVLATAVVDDNHGARLQPVNEVADGAGVLGIQWTVEDGIGAAGEAEIVIARLD